MNLPTIILVHWNDGNFEMSQQETLASLTLNMKQ
jgi:hypothetical protein